MSPGSNPGGAASKSNKISQHIPLTLEWRGCLYILFTIARLTVMAAAVLAFPYLDKIVAEDQVDYLMKRHPYRHIGEKGFQGGYLGPPSHCPSGRQYPL
ncbi:MAG: hypothetical protein Q8P00_05795, partial [Dehalococcoidia bacterium]|nr:hypothetical protein [Dehalococcoidia bacterium]